MSAMSTGTLSILDKFEDVVVKNENRITAEELRFCCAQQALYGMILAQHCRAFDILQNLYAECDTLLQEVACVNEYSNESCRCTYYDCSYGKLEKNDFAKTIGNVHSNFISIVMRYFKDEYGFSMENPEHEILLGVSRPEEPENHYYRFSDLEDDEKAEMMAKSELYNKAHDTYLDALIRAEVDYNTILDYIFVELDGVTFAERADQEIHEDSRHATASSRKSLVAVKNKKVSMDILWPMKSWDREYEVNLTREPYLSVLRALSYYDSGKKTTRIYSGWDQFVGYAKRERDGIFDTHQVGARKIEAFRYYKNGKFEVTFVSHTAAKGFASEYLCSGGVNANE